MIGDTSIEDASILAALEARRKVEENQFINNALDDAINKLQKKVAALADKQGEEPGRGKWSKK